MPEVPTIEDVASRAGVSVATVSRALRGLPHVSASTRAKVVQAAAELDYRANPHASRLAAGRSGTVGIALPVLNSWYYGNVLAGVQSAVTQDRLDMHVVTVGTARELEHFLFQLPALTKQVDGLLVVDLFMPEPFWDDLVDSALPVSTIGIDTGHFDSVSIDNAGSAHEAVSHLVELGHRRIGFIGGTIGESLELESAEQRRQGLVQALADHGIDHDPDLEVAGGFTVEGGRQAMARLLRGEAPTAVFCASDEMAVGALWAAEQAGVTVPDELSVVGFDDQPVAAALGLTTVQQPVGSIAARAVSMMLHRLDRTPAKATRVRVPTRFRPRRTTRRALDAAR